MKIKNIILAGVAVLSLASCNDYLDVDAPSAYTTDFVYTQKTEIERALNGVYAQMLTNDLYGQAYQLTFVLNSDVDITISEDNNHQHATHARYDCDEQSGDVQKFWTAAYRLVEYCNKFVAATEASPFVVNYDNDPDFEADAQVLQWIGEAKCIRAMVYHDLVVMFGDVPFSFESASERENYIIPIVDRTEIQTALINDLKAAALNMSPTKSVTVEHCSKEFAQGLIARIALTAGGYSLRPDKNDARNYGKMERPENYAEFIAIARDYADSVISANSHKLEQPYQDVFVKECNYKVENEDDAIFEIPFARSSTGNTGYVQGPTYSASEGRTAGVWGETKGNARLNAFYRFLFRDGDKRREFVNGLWYYTFMTDESGELVDSIVIRHDYSVHNNKWSKLWTDAGAALGNTSTGGTGINYPYLRYADVLLMFAEADNELSATPSQKAIDCLQRVHKRAFQNGDAQFITDAAANQDAFRKAVLDERKWEFAGENSRWRDLVRTNNLAEELMYSFLRYYSAGAQNAGSSSGYEDDINDHDGKVYIDNLPNTIYYHQYKMSEANTIALAAYKDQFYGYVLDANRNVLQQYPNQELPSLRVYNAYGPKTKPATGLITNGGFSAKGWLSAEFFDWGDQNTGAPHAKCRYSFYGFIRADDGGNIYVVRNGTLEPFSSIPATADLPVVRYILPFPNQVVQRSAGAYKNYYGY